MAMATGEDSELGNGGVKWDSTHFREVLPTLECIRAAIEAGHDRERLLDYVVSDVALQRQSIRERAVARFPRAGCARDLEIGFEIMEEARRSTEEYLKIANLGTVA